jgi:hypothetical protein
MEQWVIEYHHPYPLTKNEEEAFGTCDVKKVGQLCLSGWHSFVQVLPPIQWLGVFLMLFLS